MEFSHLSLLDKLVFMHQSFPAIPIPHVPYRQELILKIDLLVNAFGWRYFYLSQREFCLELFTGLNHKLILWFRFGMSSVLSALKIKNLW